MIVAQLAEAEVVLMPGTAADVDALIVPADMSQAVPYVPEIIKRLRTAFAGPGSIVTELTRVKVEPEMEYK